MIKATTLGLRCFISRVNLLLADPPTWRVKSNNGYTRQKTRKVINLRQKAKAGRAVVKDTICRYIFLNIKLGVDEVLSYQLKEPFDTLLKSKDIHSGRAVRSWNFIFSRLEMRQRRQYKKGSVFFYLVALLCSCITSRNFVPSIISTFLKFPSSFPTCLR